MQLQPFDPVAAFTAHLRTIALGALSKEVHELTESEKFAIAFYAGVRVTSDMENGTNQMRFRTEPVGFVKIDGTFHVHVHAHR